MKKLYSVFHYTLCSSSLKNNYWSLSYSNNPDMNFPEPVCVDPSCPHALSPLTSLSSQSPWFPGEDPFLSSRLRWNVTSYQKLPRISLDWINCSFIFVPKGASSYICKSTYHIALELFAYLCPFWTFCLDGSDYTFLIYKSPLIATPWSLHSIWYTTRTRKILVVV